MLSQEFLNIEQRNMGSQSNSNHELLNGEKQPESFVVDLQNFGNGFFADKETANSRITLQRNLSRKVTTTNRGATDWKENTTTALLASSSPKASQMGGSSSTPEKSDSTFTSPPLPMVAASPPMMVYTTNEHDHHPVPQHQITIKTSSINNAGSAPGEKRWGRRSYSFRRSSQSSQSWFSDPKRVVMFFATVSIIGTMLLIYFTLTMTKSGAEDDDLLDWQQEAQQ